MSQPFTQLDAEWRRLTTSPPARAALQRWATEPSLNGAASLDGLLARRIGTDYDTVDELLLALARRAPTDPIAAQTLLRAVTPGLVRLAARTLADTTRCDTDAELIGIAWELIVTYPCERRPHHIAANLLADTKKRYQRLHRVDETVDNFERLDLEAGPPCDSFIEQDDEPVRQLLQRGVRSAILRAHEADLIWETRICERPDHEAAADRRLTLRAMRQRRRRAESRLATMLTAA